MVWLVGWFEIKRKENERKQTKIWGLGDEKGKGKGKRKQWKLVSVQKIRKGKT